MPSTGLKGRARLAVCPRPGLSRPPGSHTCTQCPSAFGLGLEMGWEGGPHRLETRSTLQGKGGNFSRGHRFSDGTSGELRAKVTERYKWSTQRRHPPGRTTSPSQPCGGRTESFAPQCALPSREKKALSSAWLCIHVGGWWGAPRKGESAGRA